MLGFLIGFASLIGLIAVLKAGRRGCGRGWHGGGWHDHHHHHHRHERGSGHGWLRFLFRKLDTTPGQEKEIRAAVEELIAKAKELRGEGRTTRNDVARLLRTDSLDETVLGELFSRHDDRLRELHKAFADSLGRVHQALEPAQRETLASLLESSHGPGFGGPYRGWL